MTICAGPVDGSKEGATFGEDLIIRIMRAVYGGNSFRQCGLSLVGSDHGHTIAALSVQSMQLLSLLTTTKLALTLCLEPKHTGLPHPQSNNLMSSLPTPIQSRNARTSRFHREMESPYPPDASMFAVNSSFHPKRFTCSLYLLENRSSILLADSAQSTCISNLTLLPGKSRGCTSGRKKSMS